MGLPKCRSFTVSCFSPRLTALRKEIKRITGREVRESAAEVEPATGTVVHAFTTGNVVQVYLLEGQLPAVALAEKDVNAA